MNEQAKREFLEWVRHNDPFLYGVAMKVYDMTQAGNELGFINISGLFRSVASVVKDNAGAYLQYRQQKKILDSQLKRAEQGLPPMQIEQYVPPVRVEASVTPETEQAMTRVAVQTVKQSTSGAAKWALPVGIGLIFLLMRGRRSR